MPFDRFLIAPLQSGLETNLPPWLITEDAFAILNNAYVFRGRLRKRFGSTLMGYGWTSPAVAPLFSRLRVQVGTTVAGAASGTVPGNKFKIGQMFSIGNEIFTVVADGTPAVMLTTGSSTVHTYDTNNGDFVFAGAAAAEPVWFYPAEPVMGLTQYQIGPINNQPTYGFDTQFAYLFAGGYWQRSDTAGVPTWKGNDSQFFWATNWRGSDPSVKVMFVTNFNATVPNPGATDDPMYAFDGTTWTDFSAVTIFNTALSFVQTARIIISFQDRLLLLNTIEQDVDNTVNTAYPNRVRWSWNGDPFSNRAWLEPNNPIVGANPGGGGFLDASTEEAIISAEFIKNRLIVFFERSTWELAYTGNEIQPFRWQKINTELGSESLLSSVPFDKQILTMGNTGVHACNGANVDRIDLKIPQQVFRIRFDEEGPQRVSGIRDYFTETTYWTYPSSNLPESQVFPNKVLVYNYRNGAWGINDDCITVFGYFDQQVGTTWSNSLMTWEQSNSTWDSGILQTDFRQVIAGNQQGYVFLVRPDLTRNAPVMQITDIANPDGPVTLTIINHNLLPGDFIAVENAGGITGLNVAARTGIWKVTKTPTIDTVIINNVAGTLTYTGIYTGGGTATRVSNYAIRSKQWNPYVDQGKNVYVAKIDFAVEKTSAGEVTVDYSPSSTNLSMINEGTFSGSILGNNVLETFPYSSIPLEKEQQRLWHPIYFQSDGECIQIYIYMNDFQMSNPSVSWAPFEIQGLVLSTNSTSSRLQ